MIGQTVLQFGDVGQSLPADPLVVVAFLLLVGGVVFSVIPVAPGPLLSLGGVGVYWWATGDPGPIVLAGLVVVCVLALLVDWLGGAVAAKASGVSSRLSAVAAAVGAAGTVVLGPLGLLLGVAGTVFLATYVQEGSAETSLKRAAYATAGVLASAVVQALLTGSIFIAVVLVHVL